jgi:hypothetical protein
MRSSPTLLPWLLSLSPNTLALVFYTSPSLQGRISASILTGYGALLATTPSSCASTPILVHKGRQLEVKDKYTS